MEAIDISIYKNESELANTVVTDALSIINSKLENQDTCHVGLTGGSLGSLISERLANELNKGNWHGLNIWWSDERFVPYDSNQRNDLIFVNTINKFTEVEVHRVPFDIDIVKSAKEFSESVEKVDFDLIILGMGPDGHVASLFPGQLDVDEPRSAFEILNSPKPPAERITFSMKKINSSDEIWLVVSGTEKSDAISELIEGESKLPVCKVKLSRLLVDSAAFGLAE